MTTTTAAAIESFMGTIRKSGLINPEQLSAFLNRIAATGAIPEDPTTLARQMIAAGLLTRFQCEQLLKGRHRHFTLAGKYKIFERLGIGPMSTVLLCEHMTMRRLVALKLLPPDKAKDKAMLARFHREARAAARLRHPNVVTVYDLDSVDGVDYLVGEFVDGSDLQRVVEAGGPMSIDRAANYIGQAAEGLQHAHEMGLVHRDIKPANLLLDRAGTVKLLDLGLARLFQDPNESGSLLNESGLLLGTIDYLAPEQAADSHAVDIRGDIYSLGATLFYLIAGRALFEGASTVQKLAMHSHHPADRIVRELSGIPEGFANILIKMLAKNPEDRYQTPAEVARAMALWTTESVHLPSQVEMPTHTPATRRAIEQSRSSAVCSMPRTTFGKTPSGFQWPAIVTEEHSISGLETRLMPEKPVESKRNHNLIIGNAVSIVVLMLAGYNLYLKNSPVSDVNDARTRALSRSSPPLPGTIPLIAQDQYLKVDLESVASVNTTKGMFNGPDGPQAETEELVFDDWSTKTFQGVPFQLVDPNGSKTPNAVMLYSPNGTLPPRMPSAVCLKVNTQVKAIHFLGGISGWGAKSRFDPPTTSMIVRLLYADGKTEDQPLKNAVHFSDFVQIADVPGSTLAFRMKNRHLRYFSVVPGRSAKITQIELVKGPDATAPILLAVTLEQPDR